MKKLAAMILAAALTMSSALAAHAQIQTNPRAQDRSARKAEKRRQKATKKYAKAQRKAERKMLKAERKNTHYPSTSRY